MHEGWRLRNRFGTGLPIDDDGLSGFVVPSDDRFVRFVGILLDRLLEFSVGFGIDEKVDPITGAMPIGNERDVRIRYPGEPVRFVLLE